MSMLRDSFGGGKMETGLLFCLGGCLDGIRLFDTLVAGYLSAYEVFCKIHIWYFFDPSANMHSSNSTPESRFLDTFNVNSIKYHPYRKPLLQLWLPICPKLMVPMQTGWTPY